MMSAFRGDDFIKNMKSHQKLKSELKNYNLGFFEIDGQYKYDDGTVENELSVFVPYRDIYEFDYFVDISKILGKHFGQESVLVKYPEIDGGSAVLVYPSSGKKEIIRNKVGYDKIKLHTVELKRSNYAIRMGRVRNKQVYQ